MNRHRHVSFSRMVLVLLLVVLTRFDASAHTSSNATLRRIDSAGPVDAFVWEASWRDLDALLERAGSDSPIVHLFDEPQFNTQDGYIGFMLAFFRQLRADGRLVFLCLHPNEAFHLEIMEEICERFIFVNKGRLAHLDTYDALVARDDVHAYLGGLRA